MYQIFDEDEEDTITNADEIDAWMQKDVDARAAIYASMKPEQQASVQGCSTALEMWTRIQTEYAEMAAENGHLLMAKFFDYKYQSGIVNLH